MGAETAIAWTRHTFNPWWGCQRVSPGCENCYAETFDKRVGRADWGKNAPRRLFGEKHWAEPLKWNAAAEKAGVPDLVFCASMADVFEDRRDLDVEREKLWRLIEHTPWLTWQLLTKRPENVLRLAPRRWVGDLEPVWCGTNVGFVQSIGQWPRNVWVGCTVEDQKRAVERLPHLLRIPAPILFVSAEPLLESIDIAWALENIEPCWPEDTPDYDPNAPTVGWVICGGESGNGRRPFDLEWAVDLFDQCDAADVPFFFKQAGGQRPGTPSGGYLDQLKSIPERWHP